MIRSVASQARGYWQLRWFESLCMYAYTQINPGLRWCAHLGNVDTIAGFIPLSAPVTGKYGVKDQMITRDTWLRGKSIGHFVDHGTTSMILLWTPTLISLDIMELGIGMALSARCDLSLVPT